MAANGAGRQTELDDFASFTDDGHCKIKIISKTWLLMEENVHGKVSI
jgi:hypothetical protein